jgi:hypothetical protein
MSVFFLISSVISVFVSCRPFDRMKSFVDAIQLTTLTVAKGNAFLVMYRDIDYSAILQQVSAIDCSSDRYTYLAVGTFFCSSAVFPSESDDS